MSISGEVYSGGATTSQHIEAEDEEHFQNTTFKLKRTRSIGVLDEFIPDKLADGNQNNEPPPPTQLSPPVLNNINSRPSSNASSTSSSSSSTSSPFEEDSINTAPTATTISNNVAVPEQPPAIDTSVASNAANGSVSVSSPVSHSPSPLPLLQSPELLPHDDTDLMIEPSRHVDYLSYQWDVNDISKSWRYVISKKHNVANSKRLENASWRTWAQRRQNLKTISPEVVNWSKDSDVTWLYGPILNDDHASDDETCNIKRETTATSAVAGDISIANKKKPSAPKPILKKRTVQESMISHSDLLKLQLATNKVYQKQREQLLKQQQEIKQQEEQQKKVPAAPEEKFFDYDTLSAKLNKQYENTAIPENCNVIKLQDLLNSRSNSKTKLAESANVVQASENVVEPMSKLTLASFEKSPEVVPQEEEVEEEEEEVPVKEDRHIHFNEEVQQCIAVNPYSDNDAIAEEEEDEEDDDEDYYDYNDYEDEEIGNDGYYDNVANYYYDGSKSHLYDPEDYSDVEDDDDDDEGGFFIKVKSNSNAPLILARNATNENTEDSESISTSNSKVYKTIHLLPSTSLNYGSSDEESDDENPYTSSLSHNVNNEISRGYDYYYDYNTVYTVDPNHAIYGKTPDVVDVPDNLGVGSNFDYDIIENDEMPPMVINMTSPVMYASQPNSPLAVANAPSIPQVAPSPVLLATKAPFHMSDDEDSDSDDGLSIGTRRSSQALAESIFHTTPSNPQHFPEKFLKDPEPVEAPITTINPRHSSTSISKQPTSSHSLSQSFFGAGGAPTAMSTTTAETEALSHSFFEKRTPSPVVLSSTPDTTSNSLTRTLSNKSSPLPPQTTSETALFKSSSSGTSQTKGMFSFDDDDTDEENDEHDEEHDGSDLFIGKTYNSLSQVADKSGIRSPSPMDENKNLMGQAKGLAKHFFG
ncbi:uncharacterized protein SPAPADRAFT_55408 [Spathaspora passalidarum NRRL Y-27907]|uniref:Nitrogen regulatory protein areA GATA-like domain-containing protein n=1 Tax=Spathaspora passalidarum (strain NRRL Y-27907 / 11-Y1) TaxID=619300 RepID=G3AK85_SPAPN|nr:uncharacterized protein SPAPADRAFT_55408 [Spathaspora passalidarum NRRL Y-27907]EGW33544.1 hypothetical protein SPAPADRAFT_55408 [Spathaspora passalidarum NRRL Y-27907]